MSHTHRIDIETITPVHIAAGSSNELKRNLDYLAGERSIGLVDFNTLYPLMNESERATFLNQLAGGKIEKDFYRPVAGRGGGDMSEYIHEEIPFNYNLDSPNEIVPHIRTGCVGRRLPYIPGTSLKGAIRSILYADTHTQLQSAATEKIFNTIGNSIMSFLQVSDSTAMETEISLSKLFNLWNNGGEWMAGWKHGANYSNDEFKPDRFITACETIKILARGSATININSSRIDYLEKNGAGIFDGPKSSLKSIFTSDTLEPLFHLINWHTQRYLEAEEEFFKKYDNGEEFTADILERIDRLIRMIPEDNNSCLLHLGFGSGFHGITGDFQFPDRHHDTGSGREGKPRYKSRKFVFRENADGDTYKLYPTGFLRLTVRE
jgi:CRISPR/Cas system CSM-associated protein Csm5 (group 7 of RAMP superfamily)